MVDLPETLGTYWHLMAPLLGGVPAYRDPVRREDEDQLLVPVLRGSRQRRGGGSPQGRRGVHRTGQGRVLGESSRVDRPAGQLVRSVLTAVGPPPAREVLIPCRSHPRAGPFTPRLGLAAGEAQAPGGSRARSRGYSAGVCPAEHLACPAAGLGHEAGQGSADLPERWSYYQQPTHQRAIPAGAGIRGRRRRRGSRGRVHPRAGGEQRLSAGLGKAGSKRSAADPVTVPDRMSTPFSARTSHHDGTTLVRDAVTRLEEQRSVQDDLKVGTEQELTDQQHSRRRSSPVKVHTHRPSIPEEPAPTNPKTSPQAWEQHRPHCGDEPLVGPSPRMGPALGGVNRGVQGDAVETVGRVGAGGDVLSLGARAPSALTGTRVAVSRVPSRAERIFTTDPCDRSRTCVTTSSDVQGPGKEVNDLPPVLAARGVRPAPGSAGPPPRGRPPERGTGARSEAAVRSPAAARPAAALAHRSVGSRSGASGRAERRDGSRCTPQGRFSRPGK